MAIIIIFCIAKCLVWLRKFITEKKLGREGKFYQGRRMGQGEVELETVRIWENFLFVREEILVVRDFERRKHIQTPPLHQFP
ncbi:hypothetical protein M7I_7337 [Glarea lozoyensis 74030]|uniref:Uncharacterized protein n=1 Tax=Glarea lozoyensis (strain ATCC 74030 / MF5533) TaxID=1104152 RepID=H0EX12_GLAL7|nr:hypothetical protein M7I_7337 [Glarea lozoyensis 74030]